MNYSTPSGLTTIAAFETNVEAWVVRNFVATNGIPAVVSDELLVNLWWMYGLLLGGIKVQVHDSNAEATRALLLEDSRLTGRANALAEAAEKDRPFVAGPQIACRYCGSEDIYRVRFSRSFAIWSWFLLGVPLPYPWSRRRRCCCCDGLLKEPRQRTRDLPSQQVSLSELVALVGWTAILLGIARAAASAILTTNSLGH